MRKALLPVVFLVLSACEGPAPPTTTSVPPLPTTSPSVPALELRHSFPEGERISYEIDLRRRITSMSEANAESPLGVPAPADLVFTGAGVVTFEVQEGPRSDAALLAWEGEPPAPTVEGTVDGEPVEGEDAAAVLDWVGPAVEDVVVEETGAIRPASVSTLELVPSPLTGIGPGFLGPVFPREGVSAGEEWSVAVGEAPPGGIQPEWTVTGRMVANGDDLELEGEAATDGGEVDISAFYQDFLGAFEPGGREGDLVLRMEPGVATWTAGFDPVEGRLMESEMDTLTRMVLSGTAPDRDTGEAVSFELRIEIEDDVVVRMVPPPET